REETLRSAEVFDPRTGRFTEARSGLRRARRLFTATVLADGRVLAAGGANDREVLRTAEIFTPRP
ncbi:MAG: kelch repeat-containing protein, partial [Nitrospinota bacterium]